MRVKREEFLGGGSTAGAARSTQHGAPNNGRLPCWTLPIDFHAHIVFISC